MAVMTQRAAAAMRQPGGQPEGVRPWAAAEAAAAASPAVFSLDEDEAWEHARESAASAAAPPAFRRVSCLSFASSLASVPRSDPIARVQRAVAAWRRGCVAGEDPASLAALARLAATLRGEHGLDAHVVCPGREVSAVSGARFLGCTAPFVAVHAPPNTDIIVEPSYRSLMTPGVRIDKAYAQRLALAPEIWIGTRAELLVEAADLAASMAAVFAAQGLPCPPWRAKDVLLSRWSDAAVGQGQQPQPQPQPLVAPQQASPRAAQQQAAATPAVAIAAAPHKHPHHHAHAARGSTGAVDGDEGSEGSSSDDDESDLSVSPDSVLTRSVANSKAAATLREPRGDAKAQRDQAQADQQPGAAKALQQQPGGRMQPAKVVFGFAVRK